ncbi:MAG: hypothetical protein ACOX62_00350 [Christensenellales bacterium]
MKAQVLLLILVCALAFSAPSMAVDSMTIISIQREEVGESYIEIPVISLANTFIADTVNRVVMDVLKEHLNTLAQLKAGTTGRLVVTARTEILPAINGHDVYSVLLSAQGRMPNGRPGHQYIPLQFDLANGQPLTLEMLFHDPEHVAEWLGKMVFEALSADLSNYLNLDALHPFPAERFLLSSSGISFYYPTGSLTWLSGKSASIYFHYFELEDILNLEDNALLTALGVSSGLQPDTNSQNAIQADITAGKLPGMDAVLGETMAGLIERNSLQYDPEGFPDGQAYQLEDDSFRGTLALSLDGQNLSGLLSHRMNLHGLITGRTKREKALSVLGQPAASLDMPQVVAELYGLETGTMDSYPIQKNELRLYYDCNMVLSAIWLLQTN